MEPTSAVTTTAAAAISVSEVFSGTQDVFDLLLTMFGNVIDTITGNPLLYVPVLLAILGGLVLFAIGVIRRLGIKGVSSSGRRRGRRRA